MFYSKREETIWDILENCVRPSIFGVMGQFGTVLIFNFMFNMTIRFGRVRELTFHLLSIIFGCWVLHHVVMQRDVRVHLFLLLVGYLFLVMACKVKQWLGTIARLNATVMTQAFCVFFLVYGEFYYPNKELWLKTRGIAMIAVMKIISLAADVNRGGPIPSLIKYYGYILCPAHSVFGPWVSYEDYVKHREVICPLNFKWIVKILKTSLIALIFLTISNCFGEYFVKDKSFKWFVAYRKALCFRSSHYFISYLSEATMIMAGYNQLVQDPQNRWDYTVTKPLDIEMPRSLSNVVVAWNIPTHRFLKLYVYIVYLPYGRGFAIFLTFFFSALLHGLNIEIALVLLSLGGFSYVQASSQRMLSDLLNACVKIRPCINCQHRFKAYHPLTLSVNLSFIILNVVHLAYLGSVVDVMTDKKSFFNTLLKWEILDLTSHHIFVLVFALCCMFGDFLDD